jgi:hypothetical protein
MSDTETSVKAIITEEKNVVQVNYWKEIKKEINEEINSMHGLVLVTHNSVEFSDVVDFFNIIRKDEDITILYISLINSYSHIKRVLEEKLMPSKKLFVVDCVSGFLIEIQDEIQCVYRRPPRNLKEMKQLIVNNLHLCSPHIVVIDSLSQYINFSVPKEDELHELYFFLKELKDQAMSVTTDTVVLLYDDKLGSMKKLPTMFTNLILKLEVIKEKVSWKD